VPGYLSVRLGQPGDGTLPFPADNQAALELCGPDSPARQDGEWARMGMSAGFVLGHWMRGFDATAIETP